MTEKNIIEEMHGLLGQARTLLAEKQQSRVLSILEKLDETLRDHSSDVLQHCTNKEKVSLLESLINASRILNSTLDIEELLTLFMDLATREMKADRSTLYLVDHDKQELWSLIAQGPDMVEIRLPFGRGIAGKVAVTGEVINIIDTYNDPRFYKEIDRKIGYTTRNMLCMPVRNKKREIIGVIQILNKINGHFTEDDEYFLENLSLQTAIAIENAKLHQEALERRRLEAELRVAYQIQKNLLPKETPQLEGIQLSGLNVPCLEVGGDYYDFIPIDQAMAIAIGDVSGKGIPASLIMANIQAALRVLAPTSRSTSDIVHRMNKLLKETAMPNKFITFFYSLYDYRNRSLTFTNAGHNPPILVRDHELEQFLTTEDLIMGAFDDAVYHESTIQLHENDIIVFYTDGITEATNSRKEYYGEDRLVDLISRNRHQTADTIKKVIIDSIGVFCEDTPSNDDITLIVMKIQE